MKRYSLFPTQLLLRVAADRGMIGKATLEVRPLCHHQHETRNGHIVASFLVLRLEVD